jgi:hypothetical protein
MDSFGITLWKAVAVDGSILLALIFGYGALMYATLVWHHRLRAAELKRQREELILESYRRR